MRNRAFSPVYFTDENALGLGKLLHRSGRTDVVYPGHAALPEVPLGTPDIDWLQIVGERGFIVITRDRRIRTRPAELLAYRSYGVRSVWIGGKRDLTPADQYELFRANELRLQREIIKRGGGPWSLVLSVSGIREIPLADS